jgi:hypothetical protein
VRYTSGQLADSREIGRTEKRSLPTPTFRENLGKYNDMLRLRRPNTDGIDPKLSVL